MKLTHSKIWLHGIFTVANKLPLINEETEGFIHDLLKACFNNQNCTVSAINSGKEHVHILFICPPDKPFTEVLSGVYEESARLINEKFFKASSFAWDQGYILFSVSESQVSKVKEYIAQQKTFHKEKSFVKEVDDFLQIHGLK